MYEQVRITTYEIRQLIQFAQFWMPCMFGTGEAVGVGTFASPRSMMKIRPLPLTTFLRMNTTARTVGLGHNLNPRASPGLGEDNATA